MGLLFQVGTSSIPCSLPPFHPCIINEPSLTNSLPFSSANTQTFSATEAISSSPSTYDSPTTFSGGRYRNARMQSETAACRDQFVSTSPTQLHFGAGRHACPGRCFASHEIKMILINFLERYDLKLKDGEERPKNFKWQIINSPDPMGEIMMKSRRGL